MQSTLMHIDAWAEAVTWRTGLSGALTIGLCGVAFGLRRRMPAGIPEGFYATAAAAGLLAFVSLGSTSALPWSVLHGHALVLFGVIWYVLARFGSQPVAPIHAREPAAARSERAATLDAAALVCCVLAVAGGMSSVLGDGGSELHAALDLAVVLALACFAAGAGRRGTWLGLAAAGIGLLVVAGRALGFEAVAAGASLFYLGLAAGVAALLCAVGVNLSRWQRRRRLWLEDPAGLTEPAARPAWVAWVVVGLAVVAGLAAPLSEMVLAGTIVAGIAALAALNIAHEWRSAWAAEVGLLLAAESVALIPWNWLSSATHALLIGLALASAWLAWLALFWHQQLDDGRAWTTTGRMIPTARRLSRDLAVGMLAVAAVDLLRGASASDPLAPGLLVAVVLMYAAAALMIGAARRGGDARIEAGAVFAAAGAGLLLQPALSVAVGFDLPPAAALAAASSLLALLLAWLSAGGAPGAASRAMIGGVLPALTLSALVWKGMDGATMTTGILTIAAIGVMSMAVRPAGNGESENAARSAGWPGGAG